MKTAVDVLYSPEAEEILDYLKMKAPHSKIERSILNAIYKKIEQIKSTPSIGDSIAKLLIPKEYKNKYMARNLYRVELPNYWRMLYTLTDDEIKVIAFIIDIMDHKAYSKKFGYRK